MARGRENALEDLRFAAHVELGGGLIQQHDAGAESHRAQRARQRDALPLAAGKIGAALVAAREHRVEVGEIRRAGVGQCRLDDVVRRAAPAPRCRAAAARSG